VITRVAGERLALLPQQPRLFLLGAAVFLVAATLSLTYTFVHQIELASDARIYDAIGANLASGFGFTRDRAIDPSSPEALMCTCPGYPLFLGALYTLFGHHVAVTWVAHGVLHGLSAVLVFATARELFAAERLGLAVTAAGLYGLSPDLIEISAMLLAETLFLFLLVLGVWAFCKSIKAPRAGLLDGVLGLALGAAILTRASVLPMVIVVALAYLHRRKYAGLFLFGAGLIVTLAPWTIRNYWLFDRLIVTNLTGEFGLWMGNNPNADGGVAGNPYAPLEARIAEHGIFATREQLRAEVIRFVSNEPLSFVRLCAVRLVRFLSLIRPMGFWFYQPVFGQTLFVSLSAVYIAALFTTGFAGVALSLRGRRPIVLYFVLLALSSSAALLVTIVQSRYRFSAYPFLAILGAYCLVRLFSGCPAAKKYAVYAFAGLATFSIVDLSLSIGQVVARLQRLIA
jgi:4-amino-4-deoxy-L-arabinose transferase-like glycosyltransferase